MLSDTTAIQQSAILLSKFDGKTKLLGLSGLIVPVFSAMHEYYVGAMQK